MSKRPRLYLTIVLTLAALLPVVWLFYPSGTGSANASLAEYQIEKMTCGSCVNTIEQALAKLDGVGAVEVNVTSGRGRVTYDPSSIDSTSIAAAISGAGYPATLRLDLDAQEYAALQQKQTQLGQKYLAQVGERLLARSDFERLVQQRAGGPVPAGSEDQLYQAVWQDVLQRELLLSAAERNKVVVQDGEVDLRLDEMRAGHAGFDQIIAERFGGLDSFRERLRDDLIINRNIEDHVAAGITDPQERQARLQSWFEELQKTTEVLIFDPRLKAVSQGGGGCACCNG